MPSSGGTVLQSHELAAAPHSRPCPEENAIATLAVRSDLPSSHRGASDPRPVVTAEAGPVVRWSLAILLLWLLVGPRLELPLLHGLRVEDLVFALMAALCLVHLRRIGRPSGVTLAVAGVVVTGLISAAVAIARGTVDPLSSVLFAVRPAEYWVTFPAALLLLRSADRRWLPRIDVLLAVVTVLQTAFAVMQYYFGLQVGFSHASYTRAAGLTVGPYELGAISAALVVYWVFRGRFTLASLATIALAASISRVSLLAAALAVFVLAVGWLLRQRRRVAADGWRRAFWHHGRSRLHIAVQVLSVATAALVLAFTLGVIHLPVAAPADETPPPVVAASASAEPSATPSAEEDDDQPEVPVTPDPVPSGVADGPVPPSDSILQRLASTSVVGSWFAAQPLADSAPRVFTSSQYTDVAYSHLNAYVTADSASAAGAEPSNLVRFFRWHLIFKTVDDPLDVIFGLGPSFAGPSVDGSYLRFFADGGVLGVLAWLVLILMWLRRSPLWMVCVSLALLIGALFIDIVYAERPMVLYWLLLALATTHQSGRDRPAPTTVGARSAVIEASEVHPDAGSRARI